MTNARGRLRQGIRALAAWLSPVDDQAAAELLSPSLLRLFRQMRPAERVHSLNVYQSLRARGERDSRLLTAALLHDCGKSRAAYWLWERAMVVLVRQFAPASAVRWGSGDPVGWRRPFAINLQHPAWGAVMATDAGADPLVIELIRHHQDKIIQVPFILPTSSPGEFVRLLATLQSADDMN